MKKKRQSPLKSVGRGNESAFYYRTKTYRINVATADFESDSRLFHCLGKRWGILAFRDNSLIYEQLLEPFTERLIACSNSVHDHISNKIGTSPERIDVSLNSIDPDRFNISYYSKKVIYLLNNPGIARKMGMRGPKRAKMFSWESLGIQLDGLYKRILKENER